MSRKLIYIKNESGKRFELLYPSEKKVISPFLIIFIKNIL